jgi:hypothetical protein
MEDIDMRREKEKELKNHLILFLGTKWPNKINQMIYLIWRWKGKKVFN